MAEFKFTKTQNWERILKINFSLYSKFEKSATAS